MKLHPHGDASIYEALVVLANKEYFIERQGNFGNVITGHSAAAARYIECRLTPLARETCSISTWLRPIRAMMAAKTSSSSCRLNCPSC